VAAGERRHDLLLPFEWQGKRVEAIVLRPSTLDDQLRWQEGFFPNAIALLAELAGLDETTVRQVRFPDAEMVEVAFMDHIPRLIAEDIRNGRNPADINPRDRPPPAAQSGAVDEPSRPVDFIPELDDPGFDIADGQS
jgi:hypothetical protein